MNIVALIQARMGSTRLPCKMMLSLHGRPLIDWVVHRTSTAQRLDRIVVATSANPNNDPMVNHLENQGVDVFRGSEDDVLRRFYEAATARDATHVVRICADNPLIWGGEIDNLIEAYFARQAVGCDYAYNHIPRNNLYPDGLGAEMLSFPLLCQLHEKATLPAHREHCLSYIWDNAAQFKIHTFDPPDPRLHRPEVKLDVDTLEDYRKLALMPIHMGMPPAEVIMRYPKGA